MTIFEAYNTTKKKLEEAGIEDYVFEARQIIKRITGLSSTQILSNYNRKLTEYQENNLIALIHQREVRYPLQYIFGEWEFYGHKFFVGPGVLVPRADTEILVEESIKFLNGKEELRILDLCAGSGCIGITLAKEFPKAEVFMVEKHDEALRYLEKNTEYNAVLNAQFKKGDIFEEDVTMGQFTLIVSNPPYIPKSEFDSVSPETKFEPETALIANDDGMEFYKAIIKNYNNHLKDGGMLAFEVGINQHERVSSLLSSAGFKNITVTKDVAGIERVVTGIK